jgi:hypothetical protein
VSKSTIVEIWRKPVRVIVAQSLDVRITTTRVETIVAPTMDVVRRGILIGFIAKLGNGSCGVSAKMKLSGSSTLPTTIIRVVGTPQMMFTNLIMTTHVNTSANQPPMNSMVARGYKSTYVMNPRGGYQEPSIIIAPILDHINRHYFRPNKVTLKYPDFKKNVDLNVHVKVFNSVIKTNAKSFEENIINAFSYTLRNTTINWCHNYISKFLDYNFLELTHAFCKCHRKTQNDEQIYMELKHMRQEET